MVGSYGITVLESKKSMEIDLYSDYTKNKLQALTLAAITSTWICLQSWDLAYSVHHGLADQPRYSFCPAVTCTEEYEGSYIEETETFLLTSTAS